MGSDRCRWWSNRCIRCYQMSGFQVPFSWISSSLLYIVLSYNPSYRLSCKSCCDLEWLLRLGHREIYCLQMLELSAIFQRAVTLSLRGTQSFGFYPIIRWNVSKRFEFDSTWLIFGRRFAEWRTLAAAQATILVISLISKLSSNRGSTRPSKLPSFRACIIRGFA